jgi:hypothetical protein
MVKAAREQLALRGLGHLFADGDGEVVLAWQEGDLWLRQMIDWLSPDRAWSSRLQDDRHVASRRTGSAA